MQQSPSLYPYFLLILFFLCAQCNPSIQEATTAKQPDQKPKSLAITIDDLPAISLIKTNENYLKITKEIVNTLVEFDAPGIGFVNEGKLFVDGQLDSFRLDLLEHWLKADLELGNHTFGHPDYNRLSFEAFAKDILKGAQLTRPLAKKYGLPYRYFRHPFLHTGNSPEKDPISR